MNSQQIVEQIQRKLGTEKFHYTYDEKQDKLRLEHKELGKGLDISIAGVVSKYEVKKETAIDEVLYTVSQTFEAMEREMKQGFN